MAYGDGCFAREAAERLGVREWRINQFENGDAPWTLEQLHRLAELVAVPAEQLVVDAAAATTDSIDPARFVAWATSLDEPTWQATVAAIDRLRRSGRQARGHRHR